MHPQSSNNGAQMAGSVDATLTELRDMAMRQQHQIEMQQQILVAKEQRLKYLRQHEQRQLAVATENERLRRLREKVEAQELKLKKLRAMKGQVDNHKQHNNALNSELESVRALFNEKEKELSIAVAKVEQLSGQLEKLREGRIASLRNNRQDSPAMIELERLRQELLMRNKLNEQQNSKLIEQRHLLAQRKEQIGEMDARIQQLQDRLKKKRQLQQVHNENILNKQKPNRVAAVEPYIKHVAKQSSEDLKPSVKTTAQNESKYKTLPTNQKNVADNILDESARSNVPNKEGLKSNNDIPKSSVGHSTAYKVMEDTLNSSDLVSKPSSSSVALPSAVPSSTTSGVQRPGFGGYRAPNSLSNFTPRPFGSTYSTASSGNRPYVSGAPPPSLSTSDMFPKTSTPISSAAQSPAMGTDVAGVSDSHEIFITDGPTSGKPMSDVNSQSQQKPAGTPASSTASSTIESSPNTSQDQIDNAGFRMLTSKHRYASKDVIADTYTNPINQRSIQEYQKHISDIYKSSSSDAHTSTHGTGAPAQETSRLDPPAYPGAPPYNIDPMRYKPNPTRNVRRRPSMDNRESELYAGSTGYQRPVVQSDKQQVAETTSSPTPAIQKENSSATIWSPGTAGSPQSNHTTVATNNWNHTLNQNSAVSGTNTADKMQPLQESTEGEVKSPKLPPVPLPKRIKGIVKTAGSRKHNRRVSFDPLALLLDASLEGELDLVIRTSSEVPDPSAANDEGITALHNAICAGHYDIVRYLIEFGCNVNSPDSDGWTPLHCAASCNNLPMVRFLVEHGACIFATTISDHETAAVKCEEEEEGFVGCTEYLYGIQEQLGVSNKSIVYAVFDYDAQNPDELSFKNGDAIEILRKGDEQEQEWWWGKIGTMEGYVPKNLLGLHARVEPKFRYPSTK